MLNLTSVSQNRLKSQSEESIQQQVSKLNQFFNRTEIGFPSLPRRTNLIEETMGLAQKIRAEFTELVIVGIGGSSLGIRALDEILGSPSASHRLHFCDNVDPIEFEKLWASISDLKKTFWVFISKSGSTIETLVAADYIQNKLGASLRAAVISESVSNPLTEWAKKYHFPLLEIPKDVGGRFSVLSPVGMFPAAFLGFSIEDFMKGADRALQDRHKVASVMSLVSESFQSQCWITFFFFYNSSYSQMGRWIQQLWAESLGKKVDRQGGRAPRASTPMWGIGACDQHSLLQQLMEGEKDKLIIFNRFKNIENDSKALSSTNFEFQKFFVGRSMGQLLSAQASGTAEALEIEGASVSTLVWSDSRPECVGYQFMFWQLVVAGLGESLGINAFDQPGVELGKRLAKKKLES